MKLKSFNYTIGLLIFFLCSPLISEEKIDIWNNNKENTITNPNLEKKTKQDKPNLKSSQTIKTIEKIQIEEGSAADLDEKKVYGIYEPANYNFDLNMWSTTKADDLRSSLNRLSKIELSKSSNDLFSSMENTKIIPSAFLI